MRMPGTGLALVGQNPHTMLAISALLLLVIAIIVLATPHEWSDVLLPARNDLVFADRHRAYGAYALRRDQPRLVPVIGVTVLGAFVAMVYAPLLFMTSTDAPPLPSTQAKEVELAPITPRHHQAGSVTPPPRPPRSTQRATGMLTTQSVVLDTLPTQPMDPLGTPTGDDFGSDTDDGTTDDAGPGGGTDPGGGATSHGDQDDHIVDTWKVDVMPEYPGGQDALFAELRALIRYPEDERRAGTQGRVYLTFVVDEQGEMRDVQVVRGVSPLLDSEAQRALRLLSQRWTPARYEGRAVSVRFNLPIAFVIPR